MSTSDILIIDPNAETGIRLATLVEVAGFGRARVHRTPDAAAAAQRPSSGEHPDPAQLILVDVAGPEGVESVRQLFDDPLFRKTPILAVAEPGEAEWLQAVFDAGAADLIAKPVAFAELKVRMATALARTKEHERRRVREQEMYRILDSMLLHIWLLDREGRVRRANKFALSFTGLDLAQARSKTLPEIFPGPSARSNHERSLQVIETGVPLLGLEEVLEAGETRLHLAVDRVPDMDEAGNVRGVLVFGHDITGRKRAEEALKESERRYRTLVDRITVSILEQDFSEVQEWLETLRSQGVTDLKQYLDENPEAMRQVQTKIFLFGANEMSLSLLDARSLKELRYNMHSVFRPESGAILREQLMALWEGTNRIELKTKVQTIRGKPIHCIAKFFMQEARGRLDASSMVLALLDITEIRRAEEVLRRSEARYRAIVEDQTELICRYLPDGSISFVNDAYARYFGKEPRDFLGLNFLPHMSEDDVPRVIEAVEGLTPEAPVRSVEHRVFMGKEQRWQSWTHRAIFDANGRLMERQAVGQDVTVRKEMEQELQKAKDAAEEASTYKSAFLAAMSHEIRTPLTAILGLSDHILSLKGLTPAFEEDLIRIHRAGQNLLQLINELLDLSKIEAGKLDMEYGDFDLRALVREMVEMFRANVESKRLSLTWAIAPDVPAWSHGCEPRIRQVLYNLLGNAVKFTEHGGVDLRVDMDKDMEVRFRVSDTGMGVEADKLATIFDPYAQAGSFVGRKYGGTGLGLAISKRLVTIMGGEISAQSEMGRGATFTFTVPLEPAASPKPKFVGAKAEPPRLPRLNILFAEDDRTNQIIARRYLEGLGHTLTLAGDGWEALEAFMDERFDIVLMDIQMPEMNGLETTRRIRQLEADENRRRTPIMALTADAMKDSRQSFLEAGMDGYAFKPFDFPKLLRQIQELLSLDELGLARAAQSGSEPARDGQDKGDPAPDTAARGAALPDDGDQAPLVDVAGAPMKRSIWAVGATVFLEDTPAQIQELAKLAEVQDAAKIRELAHKIKGAAGNVRALRMQALAKDLERAGADEDLAGISQGVEALAGAWAETRVVLESELGQGG